jgi:hypothetical protein
MILPKVHFFMYFKKMAWLQWSHKDIQKKHNIQEKKAGLAMILTQNMYFSLVDPDG